jgi:chromate transport protein ChrA
MRLLIDILQGVGLAGAAGMRPFLPALVAGAFARADVGIDYEGTPFAFLEAPAWLLAVVIAVVVVVILERRGRGEGRVESALQGIGIVLGALLCAATIADHYDLWWPGLIGGGLCAALAAAATRSLVLRTRARLDPEARAALPVYVDGTSGVLAALSVVVAPVSILAAGFFAFLLRGGRRREGEKYAGLRILR